MNRAMFLGAAFGAALLGACGGGGDGGAGSSGPAQMKLSVADAPVDGATSVVVAFTGVELTANSGSPVTISFASPKAIDLIKDSGTATAVLFDQPIPSGSYGQVRLMVVADGDPGNSYMIRPDGTTVGLRVPSGSQTGLKLVSGFTVPDSGVVDYTVDFDLRKALTCPKGQSACTLKPAMRLVNNGSVGNIQGAVDPTLIAAGCSPAVYLYSGTVSTPEDYDSTSATAASQPIASKVPVPTSSAPYYYQFTFLPPGAYTLAFTCQANLDDPDQADATVLFTASTGAAVAAGQTTTANLP
jgi:hypothetical protein